MQNVSPDSFLVVDGLFSKQNRYVVFSDAWSSSFNRCRKCKQVWSWT